MSDQGHDAARASREVQRGSLGYLGVAIMTFCAFILGAGSLYQALRVHQNEVNHSRLQSALNLFADTGPVSPNHPQLEGLVVKHISPDQSDVMGDAWAAQVQLRGADRIGGMGQLLDRSEDKVWFDAYWSTRASWGDALGSRWGVTPHPLPLASDVSLPRRTIIHQPPVMSPTLPWIFLIGASIFTLALSIFSTQWVAKRRWVGLITPLSVLPLGWVIMREIASREAESGLPVEGAILVPLVAALPLIALGISQIWTRGRRSQHRVAYTYMAPTLLSVGMLVFIPFALGVVLAFMRHHQGDFTWVGLANFGDILSILTPEELAEIWEGEQSSLTKISLLFGVIGDKISDPLNFYFTLGVTLLWTASNVALHVSIGLALALILNQKGLRLKGVYRALLIIPWAIPNYITALIWKGMFNHQYGMVNGILEGVGLEPVNWMGSFWGAMSANVATNTWLGFPFMMVVTLGALQSIPTDLYEAARIAGASRWVQFKEITLPLLKPALLPAIILGSVWTFNMFNIIYLVSGGQPVGATDILITEAYRWAFEQDRYGYAAAYSLVIFLILLGYAGLTQKISKSAEEVYR